MNSAYRLIAAAIILASFGIINFTWGAESEMSAASFLKRAELLRRKWSEQSQTGDPEFRRGLYDKMNYNNGNSISKVSQYSMALIPEYLCLLVERNAGVREKGKIYEQELGNCLPISNWYTAHSDIFALIDPPPPIIPVLNRFRMYEITEALYRAELWDKAWRTYLEAVYVEFAPFWTFSKISNRTWLSPQAAPYWAQAAEYARLAGKNDLAAGFLMKAAVFGDDALQPRVEEIATLLFDAPTTATTTTTTTTTAANVSPEAPPIDPAVKRDALTKVVRLYAEINAHPRALMLIEENREVFENPDALRKEIEEQWIAVVKDASRGTTKLVLYGTEVYPNGNPLDVKIPWAFSDEAVTEARKLIMEKVDEEKD